MRPTTNCEQGHYKNTNSWYKSIDYVKQNINYGLLIFIKKNWNQNKTNTYTITGKRKRRYKDGDENNV